MKTLISKLGFSLAFLLPMLVIVGYILGGWFNGLTIIFVFIAIPLLDYIIGIDDKILSDNEIEIRKKDKGFRSLLFLWVLIQTICFILASLVVTSLSLLELTLFTFSFGLVTGGIGITVAHELGHKNGTTEQLSAQYLLMTVCYMQFYIEHNKGHHVWVGTPKDPATSRKGQSAYSFWIQSVFKGLISAWNIEKARVEKSKLKGSISYNKIPLFMILPIMFCASLCIISYVVNGQFLGVIIFFFSQSFIAITLLELVNYVEHYGLVRKFVDGKYERVSTLHSWNSSHIISNFFLFELQRHSDHHMNATKQYQLLDHIAKSPQLPSGYPTMILLALIPPIWFRVVDPILEKVKN